MAFIDKLIRGSSSKAVSGGTNWPDWALREASDAAFEMPDYELPDNQLKTMQAVSWVAQAVSAVANYVVATPYHVRRRVGDDREDIVDHPFEQLLEHPNPDMSQAEFLRATVASKKLTGSCYWWLNTDNETRPPDELWIIPADRIRPIPDGRMYLRGYEYRHSHGSIIIPPWQIVHLRNWHPRLPFAGLSDIESLAVTVEADHKMGKWNLELFAEDNAKFPGVLTFEQMIPDAQWARIQAEFKADQGGTRRRLRMLRGVGSGSVGWVQTLMTPKDMEFLAGRHFNREEIFGLMAPGLATMMAINATEANAVMGKKTLMDMAVWPLLVEIAAKIDSHILPLYGDDLDGEFDDPRLPDRAMELAEQRAFAQVHTVDEIRARYYQSEALGDERGTLLPAEVSTIARRSASTDAAQIDQQSNPAEPADNVMTKAQRPEEAELHTWRRYALKHGSRKAQGFNCDYLPFGIETVIKARLAVADSAEEVGAAFAGPF